MNYKNTSQAEVSRDLKTIRIENDFLFIIFILSMGGKMIELTNKETGTQFLYQSSATSIPIYSDYGDKFDTKYAFGFDECFPTVSESSVKIGEKEIMLPDHGELWSRPWDFEKNEDGLKLWTEGTLLNYRFAKHIRLVGNTIRIEYELTNLKDIPFNYLWSAHPLLNIEEEDELILPEEVSKVMLNWSSDSMLGVLGDILEWPVLYGAESAINFNKVQSHSLGLAIKLFTERLKKGKAGIYKKKSDETLLFSFDTDKIPYLGVWLCYGGWPEDSPGKEYTVALEPCSGRPDSLCKAIERYESSKIGPRQVKRWSMTIKIVPGKAKI